MTNKRYQYPLALAFTLNLVGCSVGNLHATHGEDLSHFAGNIDVASGKRAGNLSLQNGNITLAERAKVKSAEVTNGNILLDKHSEAQSLSVDNGNIMLMEKVRVYGSIQVTNGNIEVGESAVLEGNVINASGDITIASGATIQGDVIYRQAGYITSKLEDDLPTLTVSDGAKLVGTIQLYRPINIEPKHLQSKITYHYKQ
ncbi:polymer-forming cytoskeletal protein [Pseudoalteromonas piscicida]|uniref:polymer-forming cytoskeletal protein n=1 Tax=Pseudoalteromonas piscicida TaxID=43662 RepID=UPI000E359900|nr:polymer-forming cytoskeletal protein [Pseudoalteromonas piscicida]AXQ98219.1 polymer-forming cytoskeletal protein [Pseudoalteromonas piscicida]